MPTQSRANPVPLLLTRPEPQAAEFARDVRARFGGQLRIIMTPLLAPRFYAPVLPTGPFAGLILTSQTGVEAYLRLGAATENLPGQVFCVGVRTADAARAAQLQPVIIAQDAASLTAQIKAQPPQGALLHLRGRETRGDISRQLILAGIDTVEAVIYAQEQQDLTGQAQAALQDQEPVLVPLFSPRTAAIFAHELTRTCAISPLFVAAMSGEVAVELGNTSAQIRIAERPDATAMLDTVAMLLSDMQHA